MKFDNWVEQNKSLDIIALFSTAICLKVFFSSDLVELLSKLDFNTKSRREPIGGILQDFKFAAVVALDYYANKVVDAPDLLGIKPDPDYYDYTHFTKSRGRSVTRSATRPNHLISELVGKANYFQFKLIGINDPAYIPSFADEIHKFIDGIKNVFIECYLAEDSKGNPVDVKEAITLDSIEQMMGDYTNIMPLLHLYTNYYNEFDPKEMPSYDEVFGDFQNYETRFDNIFLTSEFMPKRIPYQWAVGYTATIHETLKSLTTKKNFLAGLLSLDKVVYEIKTWQEFEKYVDKLDALFGLPVFLGKYKYRVKQKPQVKMLRDLRGEPKERNSSERILSIIGNKARLIDSGSFGTAHLDFMCLLDGALALSKRTKENVRLAVFIHKHDQEENYSLGLFMPAYGKYGLSNASRWWIFYYVGNNHSGTASSQWQQVWKKIIRNQRRIEIIRVDSTEDELLKYSEDPGYLRLDTEIRCIDQMVARIRGTYPELLIANMLTNKGFNPVLLRKKPELLNNQPNCSGDLDVIGSIQRKGMTEIHIFESKGRARTDIELQHELDKFSNTINLISVEPERFCDECGINYKRKIIIKGYFVSMANKPNINDDEGSHTTYLPFSRSKRKEFKIPDNVVFWDFALLKLELQKSEVPQLFVDLLKEMPIAITVSI